MTGTTAAVPSGEVAGGSWLEGAGLAPMAASERRAFERDGYIVVSGVLTPDEVAHYTELIDRLHAGRREAGALGATGALHELSAVRTCQELASLVDHPRVLGLVCSVLGWNVHVYHSHVDVHPPVQDPVPFRYEWHQDGGRQNRELETEPRPRLSVKAGWWLSDVSQPGRGNLKVVPGSHTVNRIDGPPRRDVPWPDPPGVVEVLAQPGDVVFFDRRVWHARSVNRSAFTRKVVFFGYTYRWVRARDEPPAADAALDPVQRQLLGLLPDADGDHAWGHDPAGVPLYEAFQATERSDHGVAATSAGGPARARPGSEPTGIARHERSYG
jgi:ectoine hydroxylase